MSATLEIGKQAPNFDLASTEDVVLMLRDEVPRTPVLLFFFGEIEAARNELEALGAISTELASLGVKAMAISSVKLDELKAAQKDMKLGFPLLHDDRNLSRAYGVDEQSETKQEAIFVLVGKDQTVRWIGRPPLSEQALRDAVATTRKVSSSVNYPRRVINRLVDRWVN